MKYCGIDYSYTCPAIALWDDTTEFCFSNINIYAYYSVKRYCQQFGNNILISEQPEYETPEQRFKNIAMWAEAILILEKPDLVTLEGYALGSSKNTNNIFQTAENTSLLKQMLRRLDLPFEISTPTHTKKVFSGKGNAKKPEMIEVFEKLFDVDMRLIMGITAKDPKPIDDLVDAFANLVSGEEFASNLPHLIKRIETCHY